MKVVTMEEVTDENGYLHLTVPSDIESGRAEVIVIIQTKEESGKKYDFSEFVGKLELKGNPQKIARKMRSAWG